MEQDASSQGGLGLSSSSSSGGVRIKVYDFRGNLSSSSPEELREVLRNVKADRKPAVLRGLDLGPCVERWRDPEYLMSKVPADRTVSVHVTSDPGRMSFTAKNFEYRLCSFAELIRKSSTSGGETPIHYYLRHTTSGKDGVPANFWTDFPELAEDLVLPEGGHLLVPPKERLFSSVLRVSSPGIRVWTHYDVLDNVYLQVVGRKQAVLWAPDEALNMYLAGGDKSEVTDIDDMAQIEARFPRFLRAVKWTAHLEAGDALFIPALWFHNMLALDFGVAVNVFWKNLEDEKMYDPKDLYGNKDPLPAAKALRMLDNVLRQLDDLPEEYKDFYGRLLISKTAKKCLKKPL